MSTRKLVGRLNTNSPTSTISSDSTNTSSLTLSQSPTKSSPIPASPTTLLLKSAATESSIQSGKDTNINQQSSKRRRRISVLASPLNSSNISKKLDDNDETLSSISDVIADDEKSLKAVNEEELKEEKDTKDNKEVGESPARSRRRKLYEVKTTPMVTRKTTMDCLRNTRSLRCIRRDSQGKVEGFFEICQPKRPYRRKANSTPELSTPTKRKKDEVGKDEDESILPKKIKMEKVDIDEDAEKMDDEEEEKLLLEETIKTENADNIVEEGHNSDVLTPLRDNESTLEESDQHDDKFAKETEQSDEEKADEEDDVNSVEKTENTTLCDRPRRTKKKIIEDKPKPAKKGRKPKKQIEIIITPKKTPGKRGRKSNAYLAALAAEKKLMKAEESRTTENTTTTEIEEPLSVDTNVPVATGKESSSTSSGETSEKATSLSPDLVSEGVNVQIVKDFCKKPEFLENNRGIEEDPKLAEIVQIVEKNDEEGNVENKTSNEKTSKEEKGGISKEDDVEDKKRDNEKKVEKEGENENKIQNNSDKTKTTENESKVKITDDNSQSTDLSMFGLKDLNSVNSRNTADIEKDEAEISGSGDSLKESDILLVLEDSNEEESNTEKLANEKMTKSIEKKEAIVKLCKEILPKESIKEEVVGLSSNVIPPVANDDEKLGGRLDVTISASPALLKAEMADLKSICDKSSSCSSSNDKQISCTSSSNCNSLNSNKAVDNEVVGDNAIKDVKVGIIEVETKATESKDNKEMVFIIENEKQVKENDNSQLKAIDSLKEEKTETAKYQLHMQVEVDSGISDAVTEPCEDISMHEVSCELNNMKCNKVDEDDADTHDIGNSSGAGIKKSKKSKEERDSKKPEKGETEELSHQNKLLETPETLKEKENHLKSLGLLTHKAADEAKIEKQRRRKQLQSNLVNCLTTKKNGNSSSSSSCSTSSNSSCSSASSNILSAENGGRFGNGAGYYGPSGSGCNKNSEEYTGTLKTVIKLNRQASIANMGESTKRKSIGNGNGNGNSANGNGSSGGVGSSIMMTAGSSSEGRQSLKMTFQKGRGRPPNSQKDSKDAKDSVEETYYTIQNENEDTSHAPTAVGIGNVTTEISQEQSGNKIEEKELVLIPEKASSFGIHPGRLCQDQCFYCGGRFGLYDTPCHVAQLKSEERKQKILANEEKLTMDNCLCDACFRHVVRRAKDSSYKPRSSAPAALDAPGTSVQEDISDIISQDDVTIIDETPAPTYWPNANKPNCFVPDCKNTSSHSLRRKCIRKTIKKLIPNFDLSKIGATAPICEKHYNTIIQFLGCALCKRRLGKNHMQYINQDSERLGKLLSEQGIPVKLANNSAVCKLCRYFVNLLLKPPDHGKLQKEQFVKNYRRRLLHFHNIQSEEISDTDEHPLQRSDASTIIPADIAAKNDNEKKDKTSEEQITITKPKRGRKPKNQLITTTTHPLSSESEKGSNVGTGSNTPQSSDESNEKLLPAVTITNTVSGQIILDNDVMVDYDMPVPLDTPSPPAVTPVPQPQPIIQQQSSSSISIPSKLQSILQNANSGSSSTSSSSSSTPKEDISIVLRSNPNISMRELFHGEEELGLNINVPFGNSQSYRTPEGWTRVQTFLQYDEPTRRLWENLQKPYGNQSSFLRHLILLEKYFRNGDLVLSHNASENANVYSETVRNRLRSYDNLDHPNPSNDNTGLDLTKSLLDKIPKHVSNLPITITTKPKQQQPQNNTNKSNTTNESNSGNSSSGNRRRLSGPCAGDSILKSNLLGKKSDSVEILPISSENSNNSSGLGMTKQQKLLAAASKLIGNGEGNSPSIPSNPPQNQQHHPEPKKSMLNSGMPNLPPQLISINRGGHNANSGNGGSNNNSLLPNRIRHDHHMHKNRGTKNIPPNIIVLPDTLTPIERMQSKNWRPTLMPVSQASHLRQSGGPLYQTADGRRLPSLVQVQSGGQPYLISIHDYNRMCILRREKIVREQMMKNKSLSQQMSQSNKPQFMGRHSDPGSSMTHRNMQQQKTPPQQTSLLKNSLAAGTSNQSHMSAVASKLLGTSPQLQIVPQMVSTSQPQRINSSSPTNNTVSIIPTASMLPPTSVAASTSWLWNINGGPMSNSTPTTSKSLLPFGSNSSPTMSSISMSPLKQQQQQILQHHHHHHHHQQQQQQQLHHPQIQPSPSNSVPPLILDNNLLSKIPKSLTVIPQQKPQGRSRDGSVDDLNSA